VPAERQSPQGRWTQGASEEAEPRREVDNEEVWIGGPTSIGEQNEDAGSKGKWTVRSHPKGKWIVRSHVGWEENMKTCRLQKGLKTLLKTLRGSSKSKFKK